MSETFSVELPSGHVVEGVPLGTSKAEIMRKAVNAGLATYADFGEKIDPTEGMSGLEKLRAGFGKSFVDTGRGVAQLFGADNQAVIDDAAVRDQALLRTGAGFSGNLLGALTQAAPTLAIPGANTVTGAALAGALAGGAQPVVTGDSRVENAALGGALGGAGQLFGKAIPAVARAFTEPFTVAGKDRIAGRVLQRFAQDVDSLNPASLAQPKLPGVSYTTAQASLDPGMAKLERVLSTDPLTSGALRELDIANNRAAINAVEGIAGDDAALAAALAARKQASAPLYQAARGASAPVDASRVVGLIDRMTEANPGNKALLGPLREIRESLYNGDALRDNARHIMSAADNAQALLGNADNAFVKRELLTVKNALEHQISKAAPEFGQAEQAFAAASRPINQMQVGRLLSDKLQSGLNEAADVGLARIRPEAFAQALRNGDRTAQLATGFNRAKLANVLDSGQSQTLEDVTDYLARRAATLDNAAERGSPTANNLIGQNLLRQIAGPMGMPESWMEGVLSHSLAKVPSVVLSGAEQAVKERLAQALLNPQSAAELIQAASLTRNQALAQALYGNALSGATTAGSIQAAR